MSDVKSKRGRCNHCFQCPQCSSTLNTRSIIVPSELLGDQSPQKRAEKAAPMNTSPSTPPRSSLPVSAGYKSPGGTKLYFLSCSHCKWSTRDVGIKDKRSAIDFKDRVSPHQERITELMTFYKEYATRDNAEREKARKPPSGRRQRYAGFLDPSKFTKTLSGSDSPLASRRGSSQWDPSLPEKMAAKPRDDPQPPPEDLYTSELNLAEIPTLRQQLNDPVYQPKSTNNFWPRQLHLMGKKLHRCKGCDHILMKAEINPSSIRFKIQQVALHAFPQIRIVEFPNMEAGKDCEVLLSVTNPLNYAVTVSFETCLASRLKTVKESIVSVVVPQGEFILTPNDDVGDLLDDEGETEIEDNPEYVHSRLPGKLVLKFKVTPEVLAESVKFMFVMKSTHKSTVETDKENEFSKIELPVLVRLCKPTH